MKYVVYLTQYNGSLLPKFYIGSTLEKRISSGKYFGSVKSIKWMKGKTHSEKSKRKNSESHKGNPAWNSGKKIHTLKKL